MSGAQGILVAAPGSGTGKTSFVCGLVGALRNRGMDVRVAKCGPDYLDPIWLSRAGGRACPNLDPWMAGADGVRRLASGSGVLVVEGAMGLYDGIRPDSDAGSCAETARILGIPVLLVVDASGAARTVAATVMGMRDFGRMEIAGVVANHVGSAAHAGMVALALESAGLPPLVGSIAKGAFPTLPGRHLGLVPPHDDSILRGLAKVVADSVDLDRIMSFCAAVSAAVPREVATRSGDGLRLGLAWDDAFRFAYAPAIGSLEAHGVEVVRFSPLSDRRLPPDLHALWLCGGYPELHAAQLADNASMRAEIARFCEGAAPVLAECGGLLYLARELIDADGTRHPMCGVVPATGRMGSKLRRLGYRTATARQDLFLVAAGNSLRGHEFHYGTLDGVRQGAWVPAWDLEDGRGNAESEGWWNGTTLATWFHGWLSGGEGALEGWIEAMRAYRAGRTS